MIDDPIAAYRVELRGAAVRQADSYRRRRRIGVALAAMLAATVIVGGAIAAQTHWLGAHPNNRIRIGTIRELDRLSGAYRACLLADGSRSAKSRTAAETGLGVGTRSDCKPLLDALDVVCGSLLPVEAEAAPKGALVRVVHAERAAFACG